MMIGLLAKYRPFNTFSKYATGIDDSRTAKSPGTSDLEFHLQTYNFISVNDRSVGVEQMVIVTCLRTRVLRGVAKRLLAIGFPCSSQMPDFMGPVTLI
jgi:hypothetical protein